MLKRLLWILQVGLSRLWRVRTLEMLAPQTLAGFHERIAEELKTKNYTTQTASDLAEELMALVTESHQTWLSPEEGRSLAIEINHRIENLLHKSQREKKLAVESAIATDLALEVAVGEE